MAEIKVFRGDSYPLSFVLTNKTTGLPVPITGWSFVMTVSAEKDPVDTTNQKFSVTATIDDAALGKFSFLPTEANNSEVGKFYYDIHYTNASGHKRTISKDKYTITQDIGKE